MTDSFTPSSPTGPKKTVSTPIKALIGVAVLAVLAWVAFGFLGIHTAFIDSTVDQAAPVFSSSQDRSAQELDTLMESEEFTVAMAEAEANQTETDQSVDDMNMAGDIVTQFSGDFSGVSSYTIEGQALVLNDGTDQRFLRFENFSTNNGPDLKVILRADNGELVNLGPLQGNIGDQNYEIPVGVDLNVFNAVEIYCERFSVTFGGASLAPVA